MPTKTVGGASMLGLVGVSAFFMKQMKNNQGIANALQKEIEVRKAEKKQFEDEHKNKIKVLEEKAEEDEKERQLVAAQFQARIDDIETKAWNKEKELEEKLQQVGVEIEARVKQAKLIGQIHLTTETAKLKEGNEILQKAAEDRAKEIKQEKKEAAQEAKLEKEKIIREKTDLLNAMIVTATPSISMQDRSKQEKDFRADLDAQVRKNNDKLDTLQQQQSAANLKIVAAMVVLTTAGIVTYANL